MIQASEIHEFLRTRPGVGVDTALSLALHRAEEPYALAVLELILDRGEAESLAELVQEWHIFPESWRKILMLRVEEIYRGLRRAAQNSIQQTQLNVLSIIHSTGYTHLADVVLMLLRKSDLVVVKKAAVVLSDLVNKENASSKIIDKKSNISKNRSQILRSALREGLDTYRLHRRQEVVIAAMQYALADERDFWAYHLDEYQSVCAAVVNLLQAAERENIVAFCISALKRLSLRSAALRALIHHTYPLFVLKVAHSVCSSFDETIIEQLERIQTPRWYNTDWLSGIKLSNENRRELIVLAHLVTVPTQLRMRFMQALLKDADAAVYEKVFWHISREPISAANDVLIDILKGPSETAALNALEFLWRHAPRFRSHNLSLALRSAHAMVRRKAQTRLLDAAYEIFWRQCERLDFRQRRDMAQMLSRAGAQPVHRWCERARSNQANLRMEALRRADVFAEDPLVIDEITRLTGDPDARVRSYAVALLGPHIERSHMIEKTILTALRDKDARVRANAVEAFQYDSLRRYQTSLEALLHSSHNRVRANALKTLLFWRIDAARNALEAMLMDPRPAHRRSARWVARQFNQKEERQNIPLWKEKHDSRLVGV
ncbi:MAG: HEAT repeat domain-containing protein [Sedimentisphaerales bacterium]|nr:HEAT repeat domain-containing protein [Sedimentisphaerales bacterium]